MITGLRADRIRLGRSELARKDDDRLYDFAGGFSIDELNSDQE